MALMRPRHVRRQRLSGTFQFSCAWATDFGDVGISGTNGPIQVLGIFPPGLLFSVVNDLTLSNIDF